MAKYETEAQYLIHLLSMALKNEKPEEKPDNISFKEVYELALRHSVANMSFYAVEKLKNKPEDGIYKKWSMERDKELMRDTFQLMESEKLCRMAEEKGVEHILLKGAVLKELYPQTDFRTMSDIDIYISEEKLEIMQDIMGSLGYEGKRLGKGICDEYFKPPVVSVEVHHQLFGDGHYEFEPIFGEIWDKSELTDGKTYRLSEKYCLAFIIAHGIKHYRLGGTGIRTFMDIWLYQKKTDVDADAVCKMFDGIGEGQTCRDFIRLSEIWFGNGEMTDKFSSMEEYIIRGGTYGTYENQTINGVKSEGKIKYVLKKLFPEFRYMQEQFPVLKKAPVLLPACWIIRFIKAFTVNRRQNAEKIKALKSEKKQHNPK